MKPDLILKNIDAWDKRVILKYNGFGGMLFTSLLKIISFLGRETLWMLLMVFYLFIFYDSFLFSSISAVFLIGVLIIAPIKKLIGRDRPFEALKNIKYSKENQPLEVFHHGIHIMWRLKDFYLLRC